MSTGYIDMTAAAVEHCETSAAQQFPEHAEFFQKIGKYCSDKLWHQLTIDTLEFCLAQSQSPTANPQMLLDLYDKVILAVASKLNPLSLARIAAVVAQALSTSDPTAAKALLENLMDEIKNRQQQNAAATSSMMGFGMGGSRGGPGSNPNETPSRSRLAIIFLQSQHSLLLLQPFLSEKEAEDSKDTLASIKTTLQANGKLLTQDDVINAAGDADKTEQAIVRASHYQSAMTFYKVVGPPEAFYEQAMMYLNYADPITSTSDSATKQKNFQLAVDLSLAALTGEGVYHIARVVHQHSALLGLLEESGTHAWLAKLLNAVAHGDVVQLQQLATAHADDMSKQPALQHRFQAVQEKTTLLALVALVSDKHSHERNLSFDEIATSLHVGKEQVEWVVMRALAVGLLQGSIDQVDEMVHVTWVMPRVLNQQQLADLATKFGSWAVKVSKTQEYMQEQTPTFA